MNEYLNFDYGVFIEAGANDGISQSNTAALSGRGWRGLLVEPNPHKFAECVKNRLGDICENFALVSSSFMKSKISGNFNETGWGESLTSQVVDDLSYCSPDGVLDAAIEKRDTRSIIEVPVATLQSLVEKYDLYHIDFLSLDVEGYEYEVLQGLDFKKNPPRFMRIETSTFQDRKNRMTNFVASLGYIFLGMANENDCFYKFNGEYSC